MLYQLLLQVKESNYPTMASEAMLIAEKLRQAEQLMQAKYKKLRDLKSQQEEMKRKVLEKTSALDALKRKQKQDRHLLRQVSADVIMQVRLESSGLLSNDVLIIDKRHLIRFKNFRLNI